jgi:ubiquinone/menaquinone biosynthesis C-methylase UbiE
MRYKPPEPAPEEINESRKRYQERIAVYRSFGHDRENAMRFVVDTADPITPPVLDVGTGKGFAAVEIARRGVPVVSVDSSTDEVRFAYLNARAAGVDSLIEFNVLDANDLPFDDGHFNLVTMVNVLHHLDDFGGILGEISRVLTPGGRFLIADFTERGFEILDRVHEIDGRVHDRRNKFKIEDVAQALPAVGMECTGRDTRFQECVMIARKM